MLIALFLVFGFGFWAYKNSEKLGIDLQVSEIQDKPIDMAIKPYLTSQLVTDIYPQSKVFCSYHTYGTAKDEETMITFAYLWVYCEEYYLQNGQLAMGQGVSYPIKLTIEEKEGKYIVQDREEPLDGEDYAKSIKNMFPAKYAESAIKGYNLGKFNPSPNEQAKMYFSLN